MISPNVLQRDYAGWCSNPAFIKHEFFKSAKSTKLRPCSVLILSELSGIFAGSFLLNAGQEHSRPYLVSEMRDMLFWECSNREHKGLLYWSQQQFVWSWAFSLSGYGLVIILSVTSDMTSHWC